VTRRRGTAARGCARRAEMPLVLELGRRWVDEVVHPSTIAERPQVAITDGHTASLVVGVSATPRRRELRVRLRRCLKGHRDRWSGPRSALSRAAPSRPGPLRPPARRPWHRRLPFPRADPGPLEIRLRHRGPAGRSGRAGYDLVVGPWPQSANLRRAKPAQEPLAAPVPGQPWPPSLYAWSRWVMKNVVISTTRGRRSPNAQEVHETAVVDPLVGVRAGVASEPCTKITPSTPSTVPLRQSGPVRSPTTIPTSARANPTDQHGRNPSLRRRSTAPRVSSTPTDESSHTLGGRRGT